MFYIHYYMYIIIIIRQNKGKCQIVTRVKSATSENKGKSRTIGGGEVHVLSSVHLWNVQVVLQLASNFLVRQELLLDSCMYM